ncbi:hypothetical protein E4S40_00765 [Algoriphagus kandeliae]|uniref:O-antigen ligase-related domain-containing protein n=1 Tax=Algoriphagus kandeliae TaxID=2562278 RepID=A0A4Y9QYV1_9BACT|nr:O-antigen ligase family protein [Algoriphagus kandeliae]TFV97220.1 hypothetical protein E4S40_00765 [Algoriphagus kandeliae]
MRVGNFVTSLSIKKNALSWTIFHIVLGVLGTLSKFIVIFWFYWILLDSSYYFFKTSKSKRPIFIATLIVYTCSFELLGRLVSASPFIPYELGKYLFLFLCLVGLFINRNHKFNEVNFVNILAIILIIPSFFIDLSGTVSFKDIVFNIFGLINICIGILFFSTIKVRLIQLVNWIKPLAFLCITILIYTFIKTPDLDEIEFALGANFQTTGNFGSNQVSTVLGLGAFLFGIGLILKFRITGYFLLDVFFFFGFLVQGLLTFSRGGMIGTILGLFVFLYYLYQLPAWQRYKLNLGNPIKFILPVIFILTISFFVTNYLTQGNLLLRYMGETAGTLAGTKDKDLNQITTNRFDIFKGDMELYAENPIFGVGAAASKYLRPTHTGMVAHVELSRMIAEHGAFSFGILLALLLVLYINVSKTKNIIAKGLLVSFAILAFYTTFHAATRTFMSPMLLALSMVSLISENKYKVKL